MGFYGNITNTSRTHFQFDKTYPNRATMDASASSDGIFIGRYVLVEYDILFGADWCTIAFQKSSNNTLHFYSNSNATASSELLYGEGNLTEGKYIRVPGVYRAPGTNIDIIHNLDAPKEKADKIYKILSGKNGQTLKVKLISELQGIPYNENYTIDMEKYGPSRGYDSTVWQKVFTDGADRYVMVAELNTVVPTFDVVADAPTVSPLMPHFGGESSNVYYKLHWQPSWGFRIKSAHQDLKIQPVDEAGVSIPGSSPISASRVEEDSLPSDETTTWSTDGYDEQEANPEKRYKKYVYKILDPAASVPSGVWAEVDGKVKASELPAAIYYNKAGFDPVKISYNTDINDTIKIEPTGLSGHLYNSHDANYTMEPLPDTQELSILLPSIGNTVASLWDIVYGDSKLNNNKNIRDTSLTWRMVGNISPKNSGIRLISLGNSGYLTEPKAMSTLAGTINSMHDLMGMIIQEVDTDKESAETKSNKYIYYDKNKGKFYRKHIGYTYTNFKPTTPNSTNNHNFFEEVKFTGDLKDYLKNCYYQENTHIADKYNYIKENKFDPTLTYHEFKSAEEASFTSSFKEEKNKIYEKIVSEDGESYYLTLTKDDSYVTSKEGIYHLIDPSNIIAMPNNTYLFRYGYPIGGKATILKIQSSTLVANPLYSDYERGIYYYMDNGKYYKANTPGHDFSSSSEYYTLSFITADQETIVAGNKQFFSIMTEKISAETSYIVEISYIEKLNINQNNFVAGLFYIYNEDTKDYELAMEYKANVKYYEQKQQLTSKTIAIIPSEYVQPANIVPFRENCYYQVIQKQDKTVEYHSISNADQLISAQGPYVLIEPKNISNTLDGFYIPGMYWYKISVGDLKDSYVIDDSIDIVKGRVYYRSLIFEEKDKTVLYEPYKYYYQNKNSEYILDKNNTQQPNITYYKKNSLYVLADTKGNYPLYTEWNYKVNIIPSGVTLASRKEKAEYQELPEFSQGLNTVHGLFLRVHELLEFNDPHTRDLKKVQGVLNKLNDIIVNFEDLAPNKILITDKVGKIKAGSLTELILSDLKLQTSNLNSLERTDSIISALEKIEARLARIENSLNLI